ncbi:c-type cytochrome biogenesis protein CcsB [Nonomuraea turkmeniaca]|uniref:C-type cytochrome biogenesis protein CcsB n=1 Tax=Nonomuraea turkmeniaca TaxID=103838 RepID=A0A5S4F3T4_9ACTN|nr:cytochrome c biogenesis protein CcsA [Nonomuraea turkmeniaca]TMR10790.1 c-type cytochrome biogenesis protein CcsB [Nonomuraea turkmeniaca]
MSAEQLAELSDLFVVGAVLLYVFAMIGFATELAFGRFRPGKTAAAGAGARPSALKQPVAVGAAAASDGGDAVPDAVPAAGGSVAAETRGGEAAEGPDGQPRGAARAGMVALALAWVGWAANLGAIVTRGLAVERWPWGNMYEFVVAICFAAVTAFLATQLRNNVRFLGAFVMVTAALGLGLAVKVFYTAAGPVVPALNSYWIAIHVTAAIIASGLLTMAGVAGILYLIRGDGMSRLPAREDLERVAHRAIVFAFPVWTFAVIAGALWADRAWGRYWGWDPKEVWSFITWVAYAAYLHARVTAGWRGRAATIVQLVAFACLLFNLVGVNIFIGGLHSYADV